MDTSGCQRDLDVTPGAPCNYLDYDTPHSLCNLCWCTTYVVGIGGVECSSFRHDLLDSQLKAG